MGFLQFFIGLFDKYPLFAGLIVTLLVLTPILKILTTYLCKLSDNKTERHKALLKYKLEIEKTRKSKHK